jgi:acyl-CoA thioester hydrolase
MTSFSLSFPVRWADLDPNQHLRHTAFNDYATHVRFSYLEENGFGPEEFAAHGIGPIIMREETRFIKEVRMGTTIAIDLRAAGLAPHVSRFRLTHDITRSDGQLAAIVTVDAAWLDLTARKRVPPPESLAAIIRALPQTDAFEELPAL